MSVTFGGWLATQESRQDAVGELARYWKTLKGDRKVRALPSIQKELETAGALAAGSPGAVAWEQATAEYRGQRSGSLASGDLRLVPGPTTEITGDSQADLDNAYRRATGQEPPPHLSDRQILAAIDAVLEAHTVMLAAIAAKVLSPEENQQLTAALESLGTDAGPEPEPVDWAATMAAADYAAEQDG